MQLSQKDFLLQQVQPVVQEIQSLHVLTAIGLDKSLADSSLRVSFGDLNTKEDTEFLINNIVNFYKKIKKYE